MFIVNNRKIFYIVSVVMIALSVFSIAKWGLNFGIDFKGGSIIEVEYAQGTQGQNLTASSTPAVATSTSKSKTVLASKTSKKTTTVATSTATTTATVGVPTADDVRARLASTNIGETVVRQTGNSGYIIRTKALSDAERKTVTTALGGEVKRLDSVGPVLGKELQGKAIWSIILVLLAIVLFITFVFHGVSKPVASWKYGLVAIVALLHDVIVPAGVFAYLGHNGGYEIDALFVTALLVILGFSIHDTIVVFDRTRENLKTIGVGKKSFAEIVGMSLSQTFSRSVNTSLTTILALIALYFFGPETTKNFSLALVIGIAIGTYSSIFIASPLLVTLEKWQGKK